MAKTFLTNINLKGNQLLNAVIQSASSAPTAYAAGQLYFNTADNLFYYSTAAGSGSWVPVGVQYISSVGSNLSVNNGELDLGAKVVITDATQSLSNKTLLGVTVQGDTYFQSAGGAGGQNNYITVDANSGKLYVHSGYGVQVDATGDVVLNPTGAAYVGSVTADNEIATVGGTQTLTNKTIGDELHFVNGGTDGFIAGQAGQLVINANNGLSTTSDGDTTITTTVGNIILNADGDVYKGSATANNRIITVGDIPTLELHIEGTSNQIVLGTDTNNGYTQISLDPETYIKRASDQYPSIMLNANTATISLNDPNTDSRVLDIYNTDANAVIKSGYSLNLESQSGDITLSPSTGIINAVGNELHITKTEYHLGGSNRGAVLAHPTDGSLTVAAINQLVLESHSGNIELNSQNGYTYFNNNLSINSNGEIASQNTDIILSPDSGSVVVNNNLVTDSIISKNGGNDTLNIEAVTLDIATSGVVIGANSTNGALFVQDNTGNHVLSVNTGLASDENYYGYNNYTDTRVINLNGFIKLSSENNPATGFLFVNAQGGSQSVPALHLESTGDLALRAGAHHGQGNIILYTGATSSGTSGNVFIGYNGQNSAGANNQVATLGETETFSNKTLVNATLGNALNADSYKIENLANPEYAADAANKAYVDAVAQGINIHTSADAVAIGNLDATYVPGSADVENGYGIGAYLQANSNGAFSADGYGVAQGLIVGSRIVVKDQNNLTQNGVYVVSVIGDANTPWKLTRAADYNNSIASQVIAGDFVFVSYGDTLANTAWVQINAGSNPDHSIKLGTDEMYFTQFAGAGTYTANQGVRLNGNTFQLNPSSDGGLAVNATYAFIKLPTNSGLDTTVDGLAVGAGTGITVSGATVAVDETVIATRTYADNAASGAVTTSNGYTDTAIAALSYTGTITGDSSTTSFPITHNLGTRAVIARVYQTSAGPDTQYAEVEVDIVHTNTNTVTVGFASAPTTGTTYEIVIIK